MRSSTFFKEKIKDWHKRLEKEFEHAPAYIFRDTIKIINEMKELIEE